MRKIRLLIAPNRSVEFTDRGFLNFVKFDSSTWFRIISDLGFGILSIFGLVFALLHQQQPRPESMAVYFLVSTVIALALLLILKVIFAGWQQLLIDLPLFISVLTFAFMLLAVNFFLPNSDVRNTFGNGGIKFLSVFVIMTLAGLYYFTAVFVNTKRKFEWIIKALVAGIALLVPLKLLEANGWFGISSLVVMLLPVLLYTLFTARRWWQAVLNLTGVIAIIYLIFTLKVNFGVLLGVTLTASIIGITSLWLASDWLRNADISWSAEYAKWRKGKISLVEFLATVRPLVILGVSVVMLATLIVYVLVQKVAPINEFNQIINAYRSAFASWQTIGGALIGNGFPAGGTYVNRVTPVADTVFLHGLVGMAAYFILTANAIAYAFRALKRDSDKGVSSWDSLTVIGLFVILGASISALLGSISIWMVILWWVVLGLCAARELLTQKQQPVQTLQEWNLQLRIFRFKTPKLVIGNRLMKLLQFVSLVLFLVIWVMATNNIYGLVAKGSII